MKWKKPSKKTWLIILGLCAFSAIGIGISACKNKLKKQVQEQPKAQRAESFLIQANSLPNLESNKDHLFTGTWTLGTTRTNEKISNIHNFWFTFDQLSHNFITSTKFPSTITENGEDVVGSLPWIESDIDGSTITSKLKSKSYLVDKIFIPSTQWDVISNAKEYAHYQYGDVPYEELSYFTKKLYLDKVNEFRKTIQTKIKESINNSEMIWNAETEKQFKDSLLLTIWMFLHWKDGAKYKDSYDKVPATYKKPEKCFTIAGCERQKPELVEREHYKFKRFKTLSVKTTNDLKIEVPIKINYEKDLAFLENVWKNKVIHLESDYNLHDLSSLKRNNLDNFKTNAQILDEYFTSLKPFKIGNTTYKYIYYKQPDEKTIDVSLRATFETKTNFKKFSYSNNRYEFEIPLIRNQKIIWTPSQKYKDLNFTNSIQVFPGRTMKLDEENANKLFLSLEDAILSSTSKKIGLSSDGKTYYLGKYIYNSSAKFYFNPQDDNVIVYVNGKKLDVINNTFEADLIDKREDPRDNVKIPNYDKDDNLPKEELTDDNSHKKNEYKIVIKKFNNINVDSEPVITYIYDAEINTKSQGLDFKFYAWNPEENPNQKSLITPYILDENNKPKLDKEGKPLSNPLYNPLIDPKTGTIKELVWFDTKNYDYNKGFFLSSLSYEELQAQLNQKDNEIAKIDKLIETAEADIAEINTKLAAWNETGEHELKTAIEEGKINSAKYKTEYTKFLNSYNTYHKASSPANDSLYISIEEYKKQLEDKIQYRSTSLSTESLFYKNSLQTLKITISDDEIELDAKKAQYYRIKKASQRNDPFLNILEKEIHSLEAQIETNKAKVKEYEVKIKQLDAIINGEVEDSELVMTQTELERVKKDYETYIIIEKELREKQDEEQNKLDENQKAYKTMIEITIPTQLLIKKTREKEINDLKRQKQDALKAKKEIRDTNTEVSFRKWAEKFDYYTNFADKTGLPPFGLAFMYLNGNEVKHKGFIAEAVIVNKAALKELIGQTDDFLMIKLNPNTNTWEKPKVLDNTTSDDSYLSTEGTYLFYSRKEGTTSNFKIVKIIDGRTDDIVNKKFSEMNTNFNNIHNLWNTPVGIDFAKYLMSRYTITTEQADKLDYVIIKQYWESFITYITDGGMVDIVISPRLNLEALNYQFDYPRDLKEYLINENIDLLAKYGDFNYQELVRIDNWDIDENTGQLRVNYSLKTANGVYSLSHTQDNYLIHFNKLKLTKNSIKIKWNNDEIKQIANKTTFGNFVKQLIENQINVFANTMDEEDLNKINWTYKFNGYLLILNANLKEEYNETDFIVNNSNSIQLNFINKYGFFDEFKPEAINLENEIDAEQIQIQLKSNILTQLNKFGANKTQWIDKNGNYYPFNGNHLSFEISDFEITNFNDETLQALIKVFNNKELALNNAIDIEIQMNEAKYGEEVKTKFKVYNYSPAPVSQLIDLSKFVFQIYDVDTPVIYENEEELALLKQNILTKVETEIQRQLKAFNEELILHQNIDADQEQWDKLIELLFYHDLPSTIVLNPKNNKLIINQTKAIFKNTNKTTKKFDLSTMNIEELSIKSANYNVIRKLILDHVDHTFAKYQLSLEHLKDYYTYDVDNKNYVKALIKENGENIEYFIVMPLEDKYENSLPFKVINQFDESELTPEDKASWKIPLEKKWVALITTLSLLGGIGLIVGLSILIYRLRTKKIK
ncbi:Mbov_0399 family ICE element protein [[Mycoplasma] anseris]|uniref:Lipoprotein n=1 Tax=[Mycoplasma] anseris TaxID=92400 RepID=A0A2Z4NDB6_9BACT|nr:hypothetical protein [[Mycoplasma] anseris]AWX69560.1 hypothetical protein DP065_02230 [[Mycoplasma] anseris]